MFLFFASSSSGRVSETIVSCRGCISHSSSKLVQQSRWAGGVTTVSCQVGSTERQVSVSPGAIILCRWQSRKLGAAKASVGGTSGVSSSQVGSSWKDQWQLSRKMQVSENQVVVNLVTVTQLAGNLRKSVLILV